MVEDTKLDFNLHLKNLEKKVNKTIGLLCKLQNIFSLVTIYISFIRSHLDYGGLFHIINTSNQFSTMLRYHLRAHQEAIPEKNSG